MANLPIVLPKNCDPSVRLAIQRLAGRSLATGASPEFYGLTLSGLTASRLVSSNASKGLASTNLVSWVTGTTNQVIVTDDGDGTITLSLPQDLGIYNDAFFSSITVQDADKNVVLFCDPSEFYITEYQTIAVGGEPRGLLLVLTKPA